MTTDLPIVSNPDAPKEKPLVSVILLTYNHEKYIAEALKGLLSQTYPNLDIIITDDASADATMAIIAEVLASRPARPDVRFIRHRKNLGGFGRGNFLSALSLSRGEFIVLSCGDDIMLPTMVERMVEVWQRENVSLVAVNAVYIDEDSRQLDRFRRTPGEAVDESFETLATNGGNDTCFGAGMGFERALYDEFGWPPEYLTACDIVVPFYAYLAKGARFIPEPLLKYRVHAQNTSLSLQAEGISGVERMTAEEHMHYVHLANAFFMEAEIERFNAADPERFQEVVRTIKPLVWVQIIERARRLTQTRVALAEFGISRLTPNSPASAAAPGNSSAAIKALSYQPCIASGAESDQARPDAT